MRSRLLNRRRDWTSLSDDDFRLDFRQKGVDMRIGLDIASLAYKAQINQLVACPVLSLSNGCMRANCRPSCR